MTPYGNIRALTSELSRLNETADRKLENAKKWRRIASVADGLQAGAFVLALYDSIAWKVVAGAVFVLALCVESFASICIRRCEALSWLASGKMEGLTTAMTMGTGAIISSAPFEVKREERPN